eukprot:10417.XXX_488919_489137_1 [CDS] Oithona nana genome sequencing.
MIIGAGKYLQRCIHFITANRALKFKSYVIITSCGWFVHYKSFQYHLLVDLDVSLELVFTIFFSLLIFHFLKE